MSRSQAHIRYKNAQGLIVPGVTTVLGLLAKPQLIIWANRLGLEGIDSSKYRDDKGDIGSAAHRMILAHLRGEKANLTDFTPEQIDKAENCFLSYLAWEKGKVIEPILVEAPLVSETFQFGGTLDFYGTVDGELTLCDYKTGGIYPEAYYQLCAYRQLLEGSGQAAPVKGIILGIPRAETEAFQVATYTAFDQGWQIFFHLLQVYRLRKEGG